MKKIMRLLLLLLTTCLTESITNALPATNREPAHILIEAAVLTVTPNRNASLTLDSGNRSIVWSNLFLPEAVSWFTNLVSVIGEQNGVQYVAKFKDPLSLTVAALADEYLVTVLARPRILTSDGQTAQFYIGEPFPIISSQGYFDGTGLELDITPKVMSNGLLELNLRCQPDTAIGMTNVFDKGRKGTLKLTSNDVTVVIRDGEVFMAVCAKDSPPKQISLFRRSIHSLGALFGHPTRKPGKKEMLVLFRAKEVPNTSWDNQGHPVFSK